MKNFKTIFFILLFFKSTESFSQTIDYAYKQLDAQSCNIFAAVTTIDNYDHRTC